MSKMSALADWKQSQTHKISEARPGEVIYVTKGKTLAWGGTAIIERLSSGAVMKTPIPNPYCPPEEEYHRRNMRLDAKICAMIGEHPCLLKILSWDQETYCLTMEYLENGNLKECIQHNMPDITLQLRLQYALHAHHIIHCDLSPRNFLLDSSLNVKIAGFGGASLCGSEPSATPATRVRPPGYDWNIPPVFGDDIFGLGSLIYFIMTGTHPYKDNLSDEVEKLYEVQQFPDVVGMDRSIRPRLFMTTLQP
ncbi:kinase-like protein [Aspergillus eucalypticola CBS 122712]|uniref:EKC/KEOPS complex subunit BUD32 n=1 Tax=Aspergillus eucalypticola (strain CBS 122712 / IBT 29274) TaxID=1448314 RepID=A0A317UPG5_ASPEC|nr:kinase-like protein [Aspergillus eucalypticola CBS 122712]PWY62437.1 kinase-like protein [Aspergillus eucalypticola CBS 122712]